MSESILITVLNIAKDLATVVLVALLPVVLTKLNRIRNKVNETSIKTIETHEQIVNHHGPDAPNMRETQDGINEKVDWLMHTTWWLFKRGNYTEERVEDLEEITMPVVPMSRKARRLQATKPTRPQFMSTAVISVTDIPKGENK
jgi:hypothetical protein